MSIEAPLLELGTTPARLSFVYQLTVGDQRPHILALPGRVVDRVLAQAARTRFATFSANATDCLRLGALPSRRPGLTVISVWPTSTDTS